MPHRRKPKVLVIGASNQIGYFLLPKLLSEDAFEIFALSRKKQSGDGINWLQADLTDKVAMQQKLPQLDLVICLGPLELLLPLLSVFSNQGVQRVIAFSSTSVFVKVDSKDSQERDKIRALKDTENLLQSECKQLNIAWTLFRPTMVYGAAMDKNIHFIAEQMKRYRCFPVLGKASGLRQPVHAEDLAQSCIDVISCESTYCKAYNLSGGETLTYRALLERISATQSHRIFLLPFPRFIFQILMLLRVFPAFKFLNMEMVDRTNRDLCFSHDMATMDFNYKPRKLEL